MPTFLVSLLTLFRQNEGLLWRLVGATGGRVVIEELADADDEVCVH
jgi:hypothetical protein